MRIYRLLHQLTLRFSAIDESEAMELNTEAQSSYEEALQKAKYKIQSNNIRKDEIIANSNDPNKPVRKLEVLTAGDRAVLLAEKWYIRYGFAISYMFLVPMIRKMMDGETDEPKDDDMDDLKAFMAYMKFKKK